MVIYIWQIWFKINNKILYNAKRKIWYNLINFKLLFLTNSICFLFHLKIIAYLTLFLYFFISKSILHINISNFFLYSFLKLFILFLSIYNRISIRILLPLQNKTNQSFHPYNKKMKKNSHFSTSLPKYFK